MTKKFRLSYTKLSFYLTCPKRYYYKYVEKRPYYPSTMMKYGGNIHRAIKDFSEILQTGEKVDEKTREVLFEKQWLDVSKDEVKNLELKTTGMKQIQEFVEINKSDIANTLYLEKSFSFPLEDITIHGYIDRIDKIDGNKAEIVDYKTGNIRQLLPDDIQLNFYALVCRDYLDLIPAKLSLYFLKTNTKTSVEADNSLIELTRSLILKTANNILSQDFIPAKESLQHCSECCYKRICPESSIKRK